MTDFLDFRLGRRILVSKSSIVESRRRVSRPAYLTHGISIAFKSHCNIAFHSTISCKASRARSLSSNEKILFDFITRAQLSHKCNLRSWQVWRSTIRSSQKLTRVEYVRCDIPLLPEHIFVPTSCISRLGSLPYFIVAL